jgi:hypothetical protein
VLASNRSKPLPIGCEKIHFLHALIAYNSHSHSHLGQVGFNC